MKKLNEILNLLNTGASQRSICAAVHCSRRNVSEAVRFLRDTGKSCDELLSLSDKELQSLLRSTGIAQEPADNRRRRRLDELMPEIVRQLGGKHATMQSVYESFYKKECPDGYGYTQFSQYVTSYRKSHDYTYHNVYKPGEEWQIDFAGDPLYLADRFSDKVSQVAVLVCVMPYSNLPFMMALPKATTEWFLHGLNKGLQFMGALPKVAKSDNMKQWVTKSERYSPTMSDGALEWAFHYGIEPTACRVRRPRDKGPVESAVNHLYRYVYARIEQERFYDIDDLNARIWDLLDDYCSQPYKGSSRRQIFEEEERPCMRPLPAEPYRFRMRKEVKLGSTYHVMVGSERHFYSVPYQYVGKTVRVMWDVVSVEVYHGNDCICSHTRSMVPYGYTTVKAHMPEAHLAYERGRTQNAATLIDRAARIGNFTKWAVTDILERTTFPQQAYGRCNGVIALAKQYGARRLEAAAALLKSEAGHATYKTLCNILKNSRDKAAQDTIISTTPHNDNVRGAAAFSTIVPLAKTQKE